MLCYRGIKSMAMEEIITRAMTNYDLVGLGAAAGFLLAKYMDKRKRRRGGMGGMNF